MTEKELQEIERGTPSRGDVIAGCTLIVCFLVMTSYIIAAVLT